VRKNVSYSTLAKRVAALEAEMKVLKAAVADWAVFGQNMLTVDEDRTRRVRSLEERINRPAPE